jgi:hypothetical protein
MKYFIRFCGLQKCTYEERQGSGLSSTFRKELLYCHLSKIEDVKAESQEISRKSLAAVYQESSG